MKLIQLHMRIVGRLGSIYLIDISREAENTRVAYSCETRFLAFLRDDALMELLQRNYHQFRKLLHNKRPESFYTGFSLHFVLRDNKDVAAFNDKRSIHVVDNRSEHPDIYTVKEGEANIPEIYTDGSYLAKYQTGGYATLIKQPGGLLNLYWGQTAIASNNLIELLAVLRGLQALRHAGRIRIISDSRYVIKGLSEWMVNWRLNNWYTANGVKVKHIAYWKAFDALTAGKYIELSWVKGHNNHFENGLCDYYARQAARKKP